MSLTEAIEDGSGQILLISHHPEIFNQWAPNHGLQLVRDGVGPVRVEAFEDLEDSGLTAAELIARGW